MSLTTRIDSATAELDRLLEDLAAHRQLQNEPAEFRNAKGSWEDVEDRALLIKAKLTGATR